MINSTKDEFEEKLAYIIKIEKKNIPDSFIYSEADLLPLSLISSICKDPQIIEEPNSLATKVRNYYKKKMFTGDNIYIEEENSDFFANLIKNMALDLAKFEKEKILRRIDRRIQEKMNQMRMYYSFFYPNFPIDELLSNLMWAIDESDQR